MNGNNAAPIYKFLKSSKGSIFGDSIKWNFSKFLVDKDGNVIDRYAPTTSPLSIEVNIPIPVPYIRLFTGKILIRISFIFQKDIKKLLGVA